MLKRILVLMLLIVNSIQGFTQEPRVLIIGIDGCRPDALKVANTPNIDKLLLKATFSFDAWNEGTTVSGPSWSAMLTGVWQNKHGVNDNSFIGKNYDEYPHFFKHVEDYNSDFNTVSICQWGPINDHIAAPFADLTINVPSETALINETVNYLTNMDPDALFVHFDDVDGAGHSYGYGPQIQQYILAIEEVDAGIGQIIEAIENRDSYLEEKWLIIVSTDHGGLGNSHGGNSVEERNIFLISSGEGIPKAEIKKDSILTLVLPPENCLNDSVELYFDGGSKVSTSLNNTFNFGSDKDFTVECRVRTTNAGDVAIVTDKDWYTGRNKGFVFSFAGGENPWKVNIGDGTNRRDINGNVIHDGKWHTLSATFDRDGYLKIFEDGMSIDSVSIASIGDIYTGFSISFGADANNAYAYRGHIAEVRIFNKVISEEVISSWSCKKINSTHADINSLIGYWRLTEGNGSSVVKDMSTTAADGIVTGAVWKQALDTFEVWEYDYSNTPRIVDVAVTALEHLCIPMDPEWSLDGNSVGASCLSTEINEHKRDINDCIKVYPNPAHDFITFEANTLFNDKSILTIFNSTGQMVVSKEFHSKKLVCNSEQLTDGIFFYKLMVKNKSVACGKFVIK